MSNNISMGPNQDINNKIVATEEDALNCYNYYHKKVSHKSTQSTCFGNELIFKDENVRWHYDNFRILNVSAYHSIIWFSQFLLYSFGLLVLFTEYTHDLWFMRTIVSLRLIIVCIALFTYHKIFYKAKTHKYGNDPALKQSFQRYVKDVTSLSNFIVIAISIVNGAAYVWKSSLGSCLYFDETTQKNEVKNSDTYYYDCNPHFETGGTPINSMVLLLIGNIFVIITLRCHSPWAARMNYFLTCAACIAAASLSPDPGLSTLVILSAFLTVVIYDGVESNSMAVFSALLDLESSKRVSTSELKHFIGNVAHDLKTPLHGFAMATDSLILDADEFIPAGHGRDSMMDTMKLCKANCSFMTTAINRTVDFAKTASNIALRAKMETTNVTDAMQWAVTCINSTQQLIPVEMKSLSPDICNYIVTDKHWLMENMLCYLSNAVNYSSSGKITISASVIDGTESHRQGGNIKLPPIEAKTATPPPLKMRSILPITQSNENIIDTSVTTPRNRMLVISVEDEGIGIEDSKKSMLFQPFQQTMRLAGGTGLGLYSLGKRIDVLKGSYGVASREDGKRGSNFWFSVPYVADEGYASQVQDEAGNDRLPSPTARHSFENIPFIDISSTGLPKKGTKMPLKTGVGAEEDATGTRTMSLCNSLDSTPTSPCESPPSLHALVVEDSLVISKVTKRMLMKAGYVVDVAANGAIGLEKMKERVYTLVVMDLQMPVMDGLEATRRIRAHEKELELLANEKGEGGKRKKQVVIGCSANGAEDVKRGAFESGMDVFVPKPFSISYLMELQPSYFANV